MHCLPVLLCFSEQHHQRADVVTATEYSLVRWAPKKAGSRGEEKKKKKQEKKKSKRFGYLASVSTRHQHHHNDVYFFPEAKCFCRSRELDHGCRICSVWQLLCPEVQLGCLAMYSLPAPVLKVDDSGFFLMGKSLCKRGEVGYNPAQYLFFGNKGV